MEYTRVVVQGTNRRASVVIPDDVPVAALLPQLLDLLDDAAVGTGTLALTTALGEPLAAERTLAELGVLDGSVVHLVRTDTAPPPPEVSDVTEVVVAERARRLDTWNLNWARGAATVALGVLGAALLALLGAPRPGLAAVVVVGLVALSAVLARWVKAWPTDGFVGFTIGAAAVLAAGAATLLPHAAAHPLTYPALAAWGAAGATAGLTWGLAGGRRPVLGAGLLSLLVALPIGLLAAGLPETRMAAASAPVFLIAFGMLPGVALSISGLASMDYATSAGTMRSREAARGTVTGAYAALTYSALAVLAPLGWCLAILSRAAGLFALLLTVSVLLVVSARSRFFPLAGPVLAAGAVVAVALGGLLTAADRPAWAAPLVVAVAALLLLGALVAPPAAPLAARLRTAFNTVELIAVVALIPLVLAVFGVFDDLLKVWRV